MALPKLNVPNFELVLPSTGEIVEYRPFLVKEEKILLMALEGKDQREMGKALKNIIHECCHGKQDVDKFAPFDIEYFFIQLRSRSVSETIKAKWPCRGVEDEQACGNPIEFEIDLTEIECVKDPTHTNKIQLTPDIGLVMRYPSIDDVVANSLNKENVEEMLALVATCIESVYYGDEITKTKDMEPGELSTWLEGLTQAQFIKIRDFFTTMPKIQFKTEVECPACKFKNTIEVEGLHNFFG